MAVSAAVQFGAYAYAGYPGFYILLPGIFFSGLLFDRGSAFFATTVGAALATYLSPIGEDARHTVPVGLFVLVGFGTAIISEALRKTLERLATSERTKDLLLRELHHRTKNNMAIMAALLRTQARASRSAETRSALVAAARRVGVMSSLQEFLRPSSTVGSIALSEYLHEFTMRTEELRADTTVNLTVSAESIEVPEQMALPVGIIVNELVTNSLKHAFPDGRRGTINVKTEVEGSTLLIEVADDGVGCEADAPSGTGSRLMDVMARQLGGAIQREQNSPGCKTRVCIPVR